MFTLRCTQKLLRRGLTESSGSSQAASTLLGDWYANILFVRPQQLVLCVSERTLLPVVLPAKASDTLVTRLPEATADVLAALSVSPAAVQAEHQAMQVARIGRTSSKRVLGSLNELVFLLQHSLHSHPEWSHLQHSLWLAKTPCKVIEYDAPDRATQALFLSSAIVESAREKSAL